MAYFTQNQSVEFRVTFTDATTSVKVDPTAVAFRLRPPSGADVDLTLAGGGVVKESTGVYYARRALDQAGTWNYHWIGAGALGAVVAGWVRVIPDPVA